MKLLSLLVCMSVVSIACAQTQLSRNHILQETTTPGGGSGLQGPWSNVSLLSNLNGGSNARVELKYHTRNWLTAGIYLDQRLSKGTSRAEPLDLLHGLSNGTRAGFTLQKMWWDPALSSGDFDAFDSAASQFALRLHRDRKQVSENDILSEGNAEELALLRRTAARSPVFLSVQTWVEQNNYTFATDSLTLKGHEGNYTTPGLVVSLIRPNLSSHSFWSLNYSYNEGHRVHQAADFLVPFGTTGNYTTRSVVFGEPVRRYIHAVSIEYRHTFMSGGKMILTINPNVQWASTNRRITIQLPVYFIPGIDNKGKAKGLQGGVLLNYAAYQTRRQEWLSFSEGFAAQLFVAAPLDLFADVPH